MRLDLIHQRDQLLMRNRRPVDLNPLAIIQQMRRGVQTNCISHPSTSLRASHQRRSTQCRNRPLALRPRHMDDGVLILRVAQRLHQRKHAVKVEVRFGKLRGMFQAIIHEGIKVIERLVVCGFSVHEWDCKT